MCFWVAGSCREKNDTPTPPVMKLLTGTIARISGRTVTYQLTYDGKNRLSEYSSPEDRYRSKIIYDADDKPVRFEIESDRTVQLFDVVYGENGEPAHAAHKVFDPQKPEEIMESRITYEISGGKIKKMKFSDQSGVVYAYTLIYTGNNLARVTNDAGELMLGWKHGSQKSPYSSARFLYPVIPDLFPLFSSENEIIETTIILPENRPVIFREEYRYDTGGYPTSSVMKDETGNLVHEMEFRYR